MWLFKVTKIMQFKNAKIQKMFDKFNILVVLNQFAIIVFTLSVCAWQLSYRRILRLYYNNSNYNQNDGTVAFVSDEINHKVQFINTIDQVFI